ncbi:ATP-binding cassette domain-containing protein [Undibacterium luofuense]|uniref:ABC-F family ATP-binding cassette domain-containing protein n=1 Tax=Undibacterium luofuense TaxID=2828733 RepID=A0A941DPR4_9BURK|nr:ATP-binding cassette domain-containing protein [Undibacterium luofuense]MBR7783795.1 ABC-F family ATP-binding cassette domain-containing protein [Undibacterium luofuense]
MSACLFRLEGVCLSFASHTIFSDISLRIHAGDRIAIVGDNGSGKSTLLKLLAQQLRPDSGQLVLAPQTGCGYLPQHLPDAPLSGGERVSAALQSLWTQMPDILLLDEPANHLDQQQRQYWLQQLRYYPGTLVMISHDTDWMEALCDQLWIVHDQQLTVFKGRYADWLTAQEQALESLQHQRQQLKKNLKQAHQRRMQEQERAAHARQRGKKAIQERRWATIRSATKLGRGTRTSDQLCADIRTEQNRTARLLADVSQGAVPEPAFHLLSGQKHGNSAILQLNQVQFGFGKPLQEPLDCQLMPGQRIALCGPNGSGKSTLIKAITSAPHLRLAGDWYVPPSSRISLIDQYGALLQPQSDCIKHLQQRRPDWHMTQIREHLARFLLREDRLAYCPAAQLSGGERVRLMLALIAADTPALLILDEVTNHLDLSTRQHLTQVLRAYPGAMLVISHDSDWLQQIVCTDILSLQAVL